MDLCGSTQWLTLNVEFSINRLALLQVSKFTIRHPSPFPRLSSILDEKAREMGLLPTLISKRIQGGVSGLSPITQTSHDQSQKLAPRTGVGFLCTSTCLSRA